MAALSTGPSPGRHSCRRSRSMWMRAAAFAVFAVGCIQSTWSIDQQQNSLATAWPNVSKYANGSDDGIGGTGTISNSMSTAAGGYFTSVTPAGAGVTPARRLLMSNCTPAAVDQFPRDLFTTSQKNRGAIVLHLVAAAYMFVALAIVCDDYFVPSLECICEIMKIKPDVAGATFMAAGSSAPELAASLIGVFVAKDDIGLSAVVGSAVFNIMFVIGICGVLAGQVVPLSWWPLVRDCIFYTISIIALVAVIYDDIVRMYEAVILLALYVVYILLMYFNDRIERWSHAALASCRRKRSGHGSADREVIVDHEGGFEAVSDANNIRMDRSATDGDVGAERKSGGGGSSSDRLHLEVAEYAATGHSNESDDPEAVESDRMLPKAVLLRPVTANEAGINGYSGGGGGSAGRLTEEEETLWNPCQQPPTAWLARSYWLITYPLKLLLYISTPDCRKRRWRKLFLVTFVLACVWVAAFSYLLVWVLTIIGYTWFIPDNVMSIVFLAAGVSIPDAIASYLVIREGEGDMAVSNAVGSNVFDILLCLGLPWFLSTAIYNTDVVVYSSGLTYSALTLLSTVLFLLIATHVNGWKLDRRFGIILLVVYVLFLVLACMYELNVFGQFHAPTCPSLVQS